MRIRHFLLLVIVGLFAAFGPLERTTPTKWALIVGITDYIHFGDEIGGDLPGAVPDALSMRDVLVARWGFPPENIKLILDHDATRAGIEAGLREWLPSRVRPGDVAVFYFAGHGSQSWDLSGTRETGLVQTICPADVRRGSTDMDIVDDELGAWLRAIRTDEVIAILDSCHSGTATRALTPFARPRTLGRDMAREVPRPAQTRGVTPPTGTQPPARATRVIEIASAQPDQVAVEALWPAADGSRPKYGGAFTTNFVRNMWQVPRDATYMDVFVLSRTDLKRQRFAQDPMLRGDDGRLAAPMFALPSEPTFAVAPGGPGSAAITREAAVPVLAVDGARVELGGGDAAGITAGSIFRVGSATLRVDEVGPQRAFAAVVERELRGIGVRADTLAPGGRARLVAYRYPDVELRVSVADLDAASRAALARRAVDIPRLHLVHDAADFAHLLVRPADGDWVVYGLDGATRHVIPAHATDNAAAALLPILRDEAGANTLAALENPAFPFPLEFSFAGQRGITVANTDEIANRFRIGDEVEFRIRAGRDGYLTIVDLGTDGKVQVLFPNEWEPDNFVRAGQESIFPGGGSMAVVEPPAGRGIVRAFVTARPLVLPFSSADATQADRVFLALTHAAGQPPVAGTGAVPLDNWATAAVAYEIVR